MATTEVREDGTHIILAIEDSPYTNTESGVIIDGTSEDDRIWTRNAQNVLINGGAGNDSVQNGFTVSSSLLQYSENYSTIYGGEGNDTIVNNASNTYINTGAGANIVQIGNNPGYACSNVTIEGGEGNDSIENMNGTNVLISSNAGDDTIRSSGSGSVTIIGGNGQDSISSFGASVTINGGEGNDTIDGYHASNVSINGGEGDDFITKRTGSNVTINAGTGNDTVEIWNGVSNVTVFGELGNDIISLGSSDSGILVSYNDGDGHDTVYGYHSYDILQINGNYSAPVTDGNDLVIQVGDGSIRLIDAAGSNVNISVSDNTGGGENTDGGNEGIGDNTGTTVLGSIEYGGHTYHYVKSEALPAAQGTGDEYSASERWNTAKAMCESLGGYLAIINDANENAALYSALTNTFNLKYAYFGLTDEVTEGTWVDSQGNVVWISGDLQWDTDEFGNYTGNFSYPNSQTYGYVNWAKNEPGNAGTFGEDIHRENYAMFYPEDIVGSGNFANGEWNDGDFRDDTEFFICEVDSVSTSTPAITDTIEYNGHKYQRIDTNMTWEEAKAYCENLGGHLVTITDEGEQSAVEQLVNQNDLPYFGYYMGGINDSGWKWITGEDFNNYAHFAEGRQDGSGNYLQIFAKRPENDENAWFFPASYWDDTANNLPDVGFICEWEGEQTVKPEPPIINENLSGRIMFAQWGYGFTPPEDSPLFLATNNDLASDFGSPSLEEISSANFAVTADNFSERNLNDIFSNSDFSSINAVLAKQD